MGIPLCTFAVLIFSLVLSQVSTGFSKQFTVGIDHNIGDAHFQSAGLVSGELLLGGGKGGKLLTLERQPLSSKARQDLARLVKDNGRYKLRLTPGSGPAALTSIPAQCLVSPLCTEVLHLHVSHSGEVSAINYDQELCPCHSEAVRSLELPRNFTFAEEVKVPVLLPTVAHPVLLTPKPQQAAGKGKGAGKVAPVRTQGQGGAEGEDKEGLSKEEPPPDERTWLQKNWLLLLPVGFVVLNVLGTAAGGMAEQPAAAGRAARGPVSTGRRR
ncbi:hypothetical protein WJX73_000374 [Symbiochloris irregularis]|uniref:ER membrane protein complex subunit 10 n=1 Tax=Symbiochloris irregularis TaxID=706552 RepID=A0AAW1NN23_9CHLO